MQFYVNRKVVRGAWGGGNLWVASMYDVIPQLGHHIFSAHDFHAQPDVIFLAGVESDGVGITAEQAVAYKMYIQPNVKIVARINENDARKGTTDVDEKLTTLAEYVDGTVFVSYWLQDYFQRKGWDCKKQTVIYNGVDRQIFAPAEKLNNKKINIVTHHWSNNRMKGFDIYEKLDELVGQHPDKYTFTYIGRENGTFKNTNVVKPLFGKDLGAELGKYDVYVSASRFDPGPNHICESISCELPTYVHCDGGGAVEFAGKEHVFSDWEQLRSILERNEFQSNKSIALSDWNTCVEQYVQFAQSI